jgi:hypothetical protein
VGLDKVLFRERYAQLLAQLCHSSTLMFAPSICKKYERDIVVVEIKESFRSSRNRGRRS